MTMMLAASGAQAQSLEKSYADQCATAAAKKSEMCQLMAKALVAKLQGEAAVETGQARKTGAAASGPTAAELRARWGFLLDFVGKATFAVDGPTATADTASRWVLDWKTPGEVLLLKKLGADGTELGSKTYAWSKYTGTVERDLPSIGQIQTFSVEPNGNFVGTVLLNGAMGRERWENSGGEGYRVTTETNEGRGWVVTGDTMWLLATKDTLASAGKMAALMGQMYKNRKDVAEIKAKMQGGMTDEQFDQHIADLKVRNAAYAEARRLKREARGKMVGGLLVAAAGAATASAHGGDATQIMGGALKGYSIANGDNPSSAQLGAQADAMLAGGSKAVARGVRTPGAAGVTSVSRTPGGVGAPMSTATQKAATYSFCVAYGPKVAYLSPVFQTREAWLPPAAARAFKAQLESGVRDPECAGALSETTASAERAQILARDGKVMRIVDVPFSW